MRDDRQTETGHPVRGGSKGETFQYFSKQAKRAEVAVTAPGATARLIRSDPPPIPARRSETASDRQTATENGERGTTGAGAPTSRLGSARRRISPRPAEPRPPSVSPKAARMQGPRQWWQSRASAFALVVVLPICILAIYMTAFARPQYVSTVAFTVRSTDSAAMNEALAGFAQATGAIRSTDALILAEFLESQTLLERLNQRLDLVRHYATPHERDPVFALDPAASVEARLQHWRRMLRVRTDPATGLIELNISAFSPEMAQLIARELLVESETLLNELNAEAGAVVTAQAEAELAAAQTRLAQARAELTEFRVESRLFDPNSDYEGRAGVLRLLQGQLAQALVEQELQGTGPQDGAQGSEAPRVVALRDRIDLERERLVEGLGHGGLDYPELLADHERLTAERDFAELAYRNARTARDLAQARAARRYQFLAVYVQPTLPERADTRRVAELLGFAVFIFTMVWAIGTLARAAIHDRR